MKNFVRTVLGTVIGATTFTTASVANIEPLHAQNSFNASGLWRCRVANQGFDSNSSFTEETIISAYPNGSFKAQGMFVNASGNYPFAASGNWNVNQTQQGASLYFVGHRQDNWSGQSRFNRGGTLQNANYLTWQDASNGNQTAVACERVG